ncbi:HEPACAM family member 2 [Alligator mississippiensis]|uniref:HEPACAM family member 2 n=1 Tax=Alligator mississippiensis TaxID=8496 RepID=UPI000907089A|nr:HEPACAM family member 2 [Alligator mississippiensis]
MGGRGRAGAGLLLCLRVLCVGTFFSYQSNGLAPTGKKLFGAVGCAVVLPGPEQIGTSKFIKWEYKKDESVTKELLILMYYVETHDLQIRVKYQDDADFNETDGSLRLRKLQLNDRGLYRYRLSTTTGKWIQLEVIKPLPKPTLQHNLHNGTQQGITVELVCSVAAEKVDAYEWRKNCEPLPANSRYQLHSNNSILLLQNVIQSDNGNYSCKVSNEVSWNETVLLLNLQNFTDSALLIFPGVIVEAVCLLIAAMDWGFIH